MNKIKHFDLKKNVCLDQAIRIEADLDLNRPLIKNYIEALRFNLRQWSACTLRRGEVNRTGKKARKQKGTGGARHGDWAAPQMRKGGRAHGPKPKFDQHIRINQKEKRFAIRSLLNEKIGNGKVVVVPMEWVDHFKEGPKTALANQVFKSSGVTGQDSIVLFGDRNVEKELELFNLKMSLRNIPNVYTSTLSQLNGLDLLRNKNVFIVVSDLSELETYLNA